MIRQVAIPAMLMAAALAGASVAYAATGAGTTTAPIAAQPSTMKPAEPAESREATPAMTQAAGTAGTAAGGTEAIHQAAKAPTKAKIHYIAFSDRVNAKDIAALGSSKLSLDGAIMSAEREINGKAVEAVLRAAPDQPHYVVWVMRKDRVLSTWVDAKSGKVTTIGRGVPLRRLYPRERAEFMATARARTSLADAVAFARKSSGNEPIAAGLERGEGTSGYDIAIVNKGTLQAVWVSPGNPMIAAAK